MAEVAAPRWVVSRHAVEEAGKLLACALDKAFESSGHARLAIPGGSALEGIGAARERMGTKWERVDLTWVDERCVPESDPESNRGAARRAGWLDVARTLPLFEDHESVEAALDRVRAGWFGGLDVTLLGMGPDGHVASLFPGHEWEGERVRVVRDSPKPPALRITLTRSALATASTTILLAIGTAKRDALTRLSTGEASFPAHGLPGLIVVTDLTEFR